MVGTGDTGIRWHRAERPVYPQRRGVIGVRVRQQLDSEFCTDVQGFLWRRKERLHVRAGQQRGVQQLAAAGHLDGTVEKQSPAPQSTPLIFNVAIWLAVKFPNPESCSFCKYAP